MGQMIVEPCEPQKEILFLYNPEVKDTFWGSEQ